METTKLNGHNENSDLKLEDDSTRADFQFCWKYFLRQLLVNSGLWTTYFVTGLSFGTPTVAIPQLRKTAPISEEMASWLSSALSYSAIPWVIILPMVTEYIGRKKPFYFACAFSIISLFLLYFGKTTTYLLLAQIIQGILFASNLTISVIMVTEYTSPHYRGIFLSIKSASIWWGLWASNAIGTFFDWNYIGLFGLLCTCYYVLAFLWPESPYWLASKGRFDECAKAHRWLKGTARASESELENLISSQKEFLSSQSKNVTLRSKIRNFSKIIKLKQFYKPILLSVLVMAQYHASGKIVCSIYSIEVLKKMTDSESTAYSGMLILDGVSVLGMYVGSGLSKYFRRRTLLLVSSVIAFAFLFSMALYMWLVAQSYVVESKVISIGLLSLFFISMSCGPMIMSTSIYAELIPLRFKSSAVILTIMTHYVLMSNSIKLAPLVFRHFSLHGTFALYGVLASSLTYLLYKYLPETKDKTLQEIEEYFIDRPDSELKEATELLDITKK